MRRRNTRTQKEQIPGHLLAYNDDYWTTAVTDKLRVVGQDRTEHTSTSISSTGNTLAGNGREHYGPFTKSDENFIAKNEIRGEYYLRLELLMGCPAGGNYVLLLSGCYRVAPYLKMGWLN